MPKFRVCRWRMGERVLMGEKDLEYLATVVFLATRGGSITKEDIQQAVMVSKVVFNQVFGDSEK